MKIGVVSDTHRNKSFLEEVVEWLTKRQRIATLYHLGDDCEDVVDLSEQGIDIIQVPGIYDPKYKDGTLGHKQIDTVLGLRILLVHFLGKDITEDDRTVSDIILYGHTHKAELTLEDGLLLMNPGHLKAKLDKQFKPSFGLLDIQDETVSAKIFNMEFKEIMGIDLIRAESGLYRA